MLYERVAHHTMPANRTGRAHHHSDAGKTSHRRRMIMWKVIARFTEEAQIEPTFSRMRISAL